MSDFQPTIKPLVHDRHRIGVVQNFRPTFRPRTHSTIVTFAQDIMQRYETQQNLGTAINLTLQRNPPIITFRSTQPFYQTQYSPHLAFVLLNCQPPEAREALPLPQIKFQQTLVTTENLVHRLSTRIERIETVTATTNKAKPLAVSMDAPPPKQASSQHRLVQAEPVSQIVRRSIPANVMGSLLNTQQNSYTALNQQPLHQQEYQDPSVMSRHSFPHSGFVADPNSLVDVNRLTDQVVQAIDRRMVAYRERLGRA
ncbi:MAG: hypothetical protein MUF72_15660 [Elainella sp. Prado103]|jgi:hypothetical protein|nr:hypothetical protein [Elainella sp. Prado103]